MAQLTLSDYEDAMKDFFEPIFDKQFPEQTVLMDEAVIRVDEKNVVGKQALIPVEWLSWAGAASGVEGADIVTPQPGRYGQVAVPMAYHYAAMRITGQTIEATKDPQGAWASALTREMMGKIDVFHRQYNRMFWGDGSGVLCMISGAPTGNTVSIDNAYGITNVTNGDMFLSENVEIEIFSAKEGGSQRGTYAEITAVTPAADSTTAATMTLDAMPAGVSDNDYVFLRGARGAEAMGLLGGIDQAEWVTTFQGLSYDTESRWGAQRVTGATAGTNEPMSRRKLQLLGQKVVYRGGGKIMFVISDPNVQQAYGDLASRGNVVVNTVKLDAGWEGLSWEGKPWIADFYGTPNRAFFVDPTSMRRYQMMKPQWLDRGTGVLKQVGRTDVFEAQYVYYSENGWTTRSKNGVYEDIEVLEQVHLD